MAYRRLLFLVSAALTAACAASSPQDAGPPAPQTRIASQARALSLGTEAVRAGRPDQAIREATLAIETGNLRPAIAAQAYFNRGIAYLMNRQLGSAVRDFDRAIERDPTVDLYYANRGAVHLLTRQFTRAIDDYTNAIELRDVDHRRYISRGLAYRYLRQYDRAIADYDEVIRRTPKNIEVLTARAVSYLAEGRLDEAAADASTIGRIAPGDPRSYRIKCGIFVVANKLENAFKECERAVQLQPKDYQTLNTLAYVNLKRERFSDALSDYDAALQLSPTNVQALYGRGTARIALGERTAGTADIETARRHDADAELKFADVVAGLTIVYRCPETAAIGASDVQACIN